MLEISFGGKPPYTLLSEISGGEKVFLFRWLQEIAQRDDQLSYIYMRFSSYPLRLEWTDSKKKTRGTSFPLGRDAALTIQIQNEEVKS